MEKVTDRFAKECLQDPKARTKVLKDLTARQRRASFYKSQSEYHAKGARNLASTDTPLLAIKEAYYAAMHKANELLALKGYDIGNHLCTIIAMSEIVKRKDLATTLESLGKERIDIDYNLNFDQSKVSAEHIASILDKMETFIKQTQEETAKL